MFLFEYQVQVRDYTLDYVTVRKGHVRSGQIQPPHLSLASMQSSFIARDDTWKAISIRDTSAVYESIHQKPYRTEAHGLVIRSRRAHPIWAYLDELEPGTFPLIVADLIDYEKSKISCTNVCWVPQWETDRPSLTWPRDEITDFQIQGNCTRLAPLCLSPHTGRRHDREDAIPQRVQAPVHVLDSGPSNRALQAVVGSVPCGPADAVGTTSRQTSKRICLGDEGQDFDFLEDTDVGCALEAWVLATEAAGWHGPLLSPPPSESVAGAEPDLKEELYGGGMATWEGEGRHDLEQAESGSSGGWCPVAHLDALRFSPAPPDMVI